MSEPDPASPVGLFVLVDKKPVPAQTVTEWAEFAESSDRVVKGTIVAADVECHMIHISTVFAGIDLSHLGRNMRNKMFETAIFWCDGIEVFDHCETWAQAEAAHARAIEHVQEMIARKK